jgi:DEAD/DEAH box helicase domain-containing protein
VAGADPPLVGTELADEKGRVLVDAELTWGDQKLAVLRPDQADLVEAWRCAGWIAMVLDDTLEQAGGQPWVLAVAGALGLKPNHNKE